MMQKILVWLDFLFGMRIVIFKFALAVLALVLIVTSASWTHKVVIGANFFVVSVIVEMAVMRPLETARMRLTSRFFTHAFFLQDKEIHQVWSRVLTGRMHFHPRIYGDGKPYGYWSRSQYRVFMRRIARMMSRDGEDFVNEERAQFVERVLVQMGWVAINEGYEALDAIIAMGRGDLRRWITEYRE